MMSTRTPQTSQISSPESKDLQLSYQTVNPNSQTFSQEKIHRWVLDQLDNSGIKRILNPCAGSTQLEVNRACDVIRNDVNPEHQADLHVDFRELNEYFEDESFDAIVFDPPYTATQSEKTYAVDDGGFYSPSAKEGLDDLLRPGGVFIQFGYTTTIMPPEKGYKLDAVTLFNTLGDQDDYIAAVATKPESQPPNHGEMATRQVSKQSPRLEATTSLSPNEGTNGLNGSVTTDGNGDSSIEFTYRKLASTDDISEAIGEAVNSLTKSGSHQLHVTPGSGHIADQPEYEAFGRESYTACRIDHDSLDDTMGEYAHRTDISTKPWNINSNFGDAVLDNVVLDVPHLAFQRNIRTPRSSPENTHLITSLKRSVADLPKPGTGQIIQIGHTATLMSDFEYNYVRSACVVINHPNEPRDFIISVDRRPDTSISTAGLGDGPVDATKAPPAQEADQRHRSHVGDIGNDGYECVYCGSAWYRHPAWYSTCHECGAAPNNYCVDKNGNNLSEPHDARIKQAESLHDGDCAFKSTLSLPQLRDTTSTKTDKTSLTDFA
ncbi:class I SAM-dependent methyltransferase [Halorubrum sp. ASP1]|uniref:class I SAM-dependent methyltransferase n=1 Tax=Halorubrum sp. ASP1 TaxID=2518114 RepID=UPI0010F95963|nr:class I SAM-dependent methyltransferase [Halorubrum sp. ASP1]TKX60613.1 class I SAM-dependent methyltransferase [Halorubrum sp. ASP1]